MILLPSLVSSLRHALFVLHVTLLLLLLLSGVGVGAKIRPRVYGCSLHTSEREDKTDTVYGEQGRRLEACQGVQIRRLVGKEIQQPGRVCGWLERALWLGFLACTVKN